MTQTHEGSSLFPQLGVGVGLRSKHWSDIFSGPRRVDWFEAISENYIGLDPGGGGRGLQLLKQVRADYPVVLHGVSLSLGSTDPLDQSFLQRLAHLVDVIEPAWISDHVCWTGVNGLNLHDLLPIPYTCEALQKMVEKVSRVQDFLQRRILVENPSTYLSFSHSEMTEWEFINELAQRSDCGLLLDVNNVYVSACNHGFDPKVYLDAIPRERVAQIHLAGHIREGGFLIDTHDQPVCDDVWRLYQYTVQRLGGVSAMIERDDNIPAYGELLVEVDQIRKIQNDLFTEKSNGIRPHGPAIAELA